MTDRVAARAAPAADVHAPHLCLSGPSLAAGAALITVAVVVPSPVVVGVLRGADGAALGQIVLGATLFRIGLGILGVITIILGNVAIWKDDPGSEKRRSDSREALIRTVLGLIILAAATLRLIGLNAGLWYDEIVTDVLYARLPYGTIVTTFESENQHFLYSILAHTSIQLFGDSAWALRLPAALFGVGSVWALYLLAREVATATEALFSAAILAFSYTHIWFSQDARGYSGLLFFATLSSWLFLRALDAARPRLWVLYAVAAALGLYVHATMIFVVVGHLVLYAKALVARRRQVWTNRWSGLVLGFGLAALLTFQLYALVLPQVASGMGREQSVVAAWKDPLWTALEVAKGLQVNFAGGVAAVAALVVFGAGFLGYARTRHEVLVLLVLPAALGAAVVVGLGHHLWPRFFLFAVGFGALVVIRGTMEIGRRLVLTLRQPAATSTLVGAILCSGLIVASARSIPAAYRPKQNYVEAASFVEANRQIGDTVVTTGLAAFPYQRLYHEDWTDVESVAALDAIRGRARRTWMIYTFPPVLEAEQPDIMASIKRDFQVVKQFDGSVDGGVIFVCRSDAPPMERASR